jgi:hypothetical protein
MNIVLCFSCHGILNPRQETARTHGTKNSSVKIDVAKVGLINLVSKAQHEDFRIICIIEEGCPKYIWWGGKKRKYEMRSTDLTNAE